MTYEPLHHKYRPQTFAELVGQDAIATSLSNALEQARIAPAYLFTGARGTGKTSSARIFAKSLNCLASDKPTADPCGKCETCRAIANGSSLDVIEIDAASNTGVDNIRELIERAQFAPVQCRYKVYVIDECHMLTAAAFNALLKTLEEPPDRVVFVLATTDPQKVLPTIISRCQRFPFSRIELEAMVRHLTKIANLEAIDIAPEAVYLIAQISQGGLRDAQSLLDQLSLIRGQITVEKVWDLVGAVPERDLLELVRAIAGDDPATVLDTARRLMDRGREPLIVLQNLASFYRDLLIAKTAPDRSDLVAITAPTWASMVEFVQNISIGFIQTGQRCLQENEVRVRNTTQPRLWLEVALLGLLPSAVSREVQQPVAANYQAPAVNRAPVPQRQPAGQSAGQPGGQPAGQLGDQSSGQTARYTAGQPAAQQVGQPAGQSVGQPANGAAHNGQNGTSKPPAPAVEAAPIAPTNGHIEPSPGEEPIAAADIEPYPQEPPQEDLPERSAAIAPEAIVPLVSSSALQLNELWKQILDSLHPLSKALLKDHGQLLSLKDQYAEVGISSQNLFKIAQSKLPDVETAFERVLEQKIKVGLVVAALAENRPDDTAENGSAPPSSDRPSPPKPPPAKKLYSPAPESTPAQEVAEAKSARPYQVAESMQEWPSAGVESRVADAPEFTPPQISWEAEDEVIRAAKSFAQMFNGQIVSMEDEFGVDREVLVESAAVALTEADDEDDVPF